MKAAARCPLGYVHNDLFTHQRSRRGYRLVGTLADGEKNQSQDVGKRETRINVYKFSEQVHLSDQGRNFRCIEFNFNIDLRDKN
jgi:hypothetical protein